ncbi:carboxypeptidase B-like [Daphnia pulex]|uniref:carboxypeptidase B-like n=1 Tax=Daphnia pulex TaxID=6669 RepID=UPI001EDF775F|nr:carboxypeptidase B-like [Daphnia pulex]
MKRLVICWISLISFCTAIQYDGYRVYEARPNNAAQVEALSNLELSELFDFWTTARLNTPTDIMTPPEQVEELLDFLKSHSIQYRLKIGDVQQVIDEQRNKIPSEMIQGLSSKSYNLTWDNYYRYDDIREFAYALSASYPQLVTVSVAGKSYEDRDLILIKISSGGSGTKNAIFVDGGIHACEWISPATVTYIIRELVENYDAHPQYVDDVDWFFMPLVNPDGYEFAHTESRLWRKNRRIHDETNTTCIGTDINRNFDYHFNEGGSSDNPCAPTYNGGQPFTEPESRALRDAILAEANRTKSYLTVHSYGQHWLTPWGWTTEYPDDYDAMFALATDAVAALTVVYGTVYDIGSSANLLYANSGPSDDWAKGVAGIPYTYTIELRDQGPVYGFLLPPDQIIPSGIETWEAFKVIAEAVAQMV